MSYIWNTGISVGLQKLGIQGSLQDAVQLNWSHGVFCPTGWWWCGLKIHRHPRNHGRIQARLPLFFDTILRFVSAYTHRNFPELYYSLSMPIPGSASTVDIIMIDTVTLCGNTKSDASSEPPSGPDDVQLAEDQWAWLESKLQASKWVYFQNSGHMQIQSKRYLYWFRFICEKKTRAMFRRRKKKGV